jgi:hypothetical protein
LGLGGDAVTDQEGCCYQVYTEDTLFEISTEILFKGILQTYIELCFGAKPGLRLYGLQATLCHGTLRNQAPITQIQH